MTATTLITGAGGFIARHVARLVKDTVGDRVVGVDLRPIHDTACDQCHVVDLTDLSATCRVIADTRPTTVYHLVGLMRGSDEEIDSSNVATTRNVLEALRRVVPDARVVLVGSAAEYGVVPIAEQPVVESFVGVPTGAYGRAKQQVTALATAAAQQFGQQVAVARPFNVIGPGVSDTLVVGAIMHRLRAALAGPAPRSIRIGRTTAVRDFVAVEDVAKGLLRIGANGRAGQCYNLSSGAGHAVAEVLERLLLEAGDAIAVEPDEALLRSGDVDEMIGSWAKAGRELAWQPTIPFEASLQAAWRASDPAATRRATIGPTTTRPPN